MPRLLSLAVLCLGLLLLLPASYAQAQPADTAHVPVAALTPGTSQYKTVIEVGGQTIPLDIVSEIREENGFWVIREFAQTPGGTVVDEVRLATGTLLPRARKVQQGPVQIDLAFSDSAVTGSVAMGGPSQQVNVPLPGALFADGAGAYAVLATLPLAEGYKARFRNLDLQTLQVKMLEMHVTAKEMLTLGSSTYEAWRAEIRETAGGGNEVTIWINTDGSRRLLKTNALLANGATVHQELSQ
jgi:hypothetical protein